MGDFNHPHPLPLARERGATYSLYLLLCHWRLVRQWHTPRLFSYAALAAGILYAANDARMSVAVAGSLPAF